MLLHQTISTVVEASHINFQPIDWVPGVTGIATFTPTFLAGMKMKEDGVRWPTVHKLIERAACSNIILTPALFLFIPDFPVIAVTSCMSFLGIEAGLFLGHKVAKRY